LSVVILIISLLTLNVCGQREHRKHMIQVFRCIISLLQFTIFRIHNKKCLNIKDQTNQTQANHTRETEATAFQISRLLLLLKRAQGIPNLSVILTC
jgi:hypothetical protein